MKKIITSICIVAASLTSALAQNAPLTELQMRVMLKERGVEYSKNKTEIDNYYKRTIAKGSKATQAKLASLLSSPEQDCNSAIAVCQNSYSQAQSYSGSGSIDDIPNSSSCLGDGEKNSAWYRFTTNSAGVFDFDINPNDPIDDYDWALYDLTGKNCADIASGAVTPIRCNYSATNGSTGLNSGAANASEGAGGPNQSTTINVTAGQSFVLIVSNYSSSASGYQLNFGGTAQIFDVTPPSVSSLVSACGSSSLQVNMNEPVLCTSINATDFVVSNVTNSTNYTVTAAVGVNCGASTSQVLLTITPALPTNLTDSIRVKIVLGTDGNTLIDQCGNAVAPNTIKTYVNSASVSNAPLTVTANDTLCAGGEVTITAPPALSYIWSTGATTQTINTIVNTTTTYTVTMPNGTCGNSAGTVQVVTITGPTIAFTAPTTVCVGQPLIIANNSIASTCDGDGDEICDPSGFLTGCSIFSSCDPTPASNWIPTLVNNTWSFGDGGVNGYSTAVNPGSHTYGDTGTYNITYTIDAPPAQVFGISINDNCTSQMIRQVKVIERPNAAWNTPGVVCNNGGAVALKPLITGDTTGVFTCPTCPNSSLAGNVFHPDSVLGALPQQFVISYTVGNGTCNEIKTQTIVVNGKDSADFMLPTTICQANGTLNLDSLVNGTIGGNWDITTLPTSNGKIDTLMGVHYLNLDSTQFALGVDTATIHIRYIVGDALSLCGVDTAVKSILVLRTPTPDFVTPDVCQSTSGLFLNPLALASGLDSSNSIWVRPGLVKEIPLTSGNYYLADSAISGLINIKHITINTVAGLTCRDSIIKPIKVNITPQVNANNATIVNVTCFKTDGSITHVQALPAFGIPYTYQWYAGQDTTLPATIIAGATHDSLLTQPVGYYTINVMNGACRAKQTFEIKSVRVPVITGSPWYYNKLCTTNGQIIKATTQFINASVTYSIIDSANGLLPSFPRYNQSAMDTTPVYNITPSTYYVIFKDSSTTCIDTVKFKVITVIDTAVFNVGTTTPSLCTANNGAVTGVVLKHPASSNPLNTTWTNTATNTVVPSAQGMLNPTPLAPGTYKLDVTDAYGCVSTIYKTITQKTDTAVATVGATTASICAANNGSVTGITLNYPASSNPANTTWTNTATNTAVPSAQGVLNPAPLAPATYMLSVTDSFGCISTIYKTVAQQLDSVFTNKGTTTNAICTATNGTVSGITITNAPEQSAIWTNGLGQNVGTTLSLNSLATGTYNLTVVDKYGCTSTLSQTVGVTIDAVFTNTGAATYTICGKASADINNIVIKNEPRQSITWHNQSNTTFNNTLPISLQNVNAGVYTVTVIDAFGCKDSLKYNVADSTYANAAFTTNTVAGTEALSVNFTNTSTNQAGNTFNWAFGDAKDTVAYNATHIYANYGVYTALLTVTDKFNCVDTQTVIINVYEKFDPKVPNIFTPNGDAKNDVFKVMGSGIKTINYVIFDRWGKRVFESDALTGWDGSGQHDGTYYYVIKIAATDNVQTKELKGYIQLIK
ncbi:MAG: gliding motility-associated C-terminal domain-containing protein [Bacteroidia bacterium]